MNSTASIRDKIIAWSIHIFTATGVVIGFLALEMAFENKPYEATLLLLITIFIDGIDGTFARKFRVKEVLPNIDGHLIDFVVDFVNFVITPTVIFYKIKMVPDAFLFPSVALILYSSIYHYSNKDNVTDGYKFKGFPAFWNLIIYYLFILELDPWINLFITMVFILLHFVPIHFIYFSKMKYNKALSWAALLILIIANAMILYHYPNGNSVWSILAVLPLLVLILLGFVDRELFQSKQKNMTKRI